MAHNLNDIMESAQGYEEFDEVKANNGIGIKTIGIAIGFVIGLVAIILVIATLFNGSSDPAPDQTAPQPTQPEQAPQSVELLGEGEIVGEKDGWKGIEPPDYTKELLRKEKERQDALAQGGSTGAGNGGGSLAESDQSSDVAGSDFTYVKPKTSLDGNADLVSLNATARNYGLGLYRADDEIVSLTLSKRCELPREEVKAYVSKFKDAVGREIKPDELKIEISKPRLGIAFVRYTPAGIEDLSEEVYFLWDTSVGKWVMDSCNN